MKVFGYINDLLLKIFSVVLPIFPWMAPVGVLFSLVTAIDANYNALISAINGLATKLSGMPASAYVGQANRIIPLGEMVGMLAALLGLKVTCMLVRFIKSWIPTVN